jgi:signal peptidase I
MMILDWFLSKRVREATTLRKHVEKLLHHQRDILSPQAVEAVQGGTESLRAAVARRAKPEDLDKEMENLEKVAGKWLKPYPHAAWRENVEVLLVALAVAMGIRTFFLQPFKIPTGSMQPTLFGVTSQNLLGEPDVQIPTGFERVRDWFRGISYLHVVADKGGEFQRAEPPSRLLIFNIRQVLWVGGEAYTIWFPPDYGVVPLETRAGLQGLSFTNGQDIIKLKIAAGDHLFIDRVTYNFRPPTRGEIIVFETKGIPEERRKWFGIPGDQFYIKRLVALGGERVQIGADRHLRINGKRLEASMPHFENVYGFDPKSEPRESQYSGHVGETVDPRLAPFFAGKPDGVAVPPEDFLVMGDNTMNSLDSRAWGPFPSRFVIGKSFFVYWPITDRFGWGYHR